MYYKVLNFSYLYRTDFFNETIFNFFIRDNRIEKKTILWNMISEPFIKSAFILFSDKENSSLVSDILYPTIGFSENMFGIYLENLFINSYSFSFPIGQLPSANVSFGVDDLKVSKVSKVSSDYFINKIDNTKIKLNRQNVDNLFYRTNFGNFSTTAEKNSLITLKDISIITNEINSTQAPIIDLTNFLSGFLDDFNISIDFGRNKFYFFESGNKPKNTEFLFPCKGSLNFSGISANFTEKQLSDFVKNDKKFSITIAVGSNDGDSDYARIIISNIVLEEFSYNINMNNFLNYSIKCSFEINSTDGFIIDQYQVRENLLVGSNIFSSDGHLLKTLETNQTLNHPN